MHSWPGDNSDIFTECKCTERAGDDEDDDDDVDDCATAAESEVPFSFIHSKLSALSVGLGRKAAAPLPHLSY